MSTQRKNVAILAGPLLAVGLYVGLEPFGVEQSIRATLAITLLTALWWVTEALPIPATSLVPFALFPLSGVLTHQQAADAVGRSRAAVTNLLRLLDLNPDVKRMLEKGELEMGHARALLGLPGDGQSQAAARVVASMHMWLMAPQMTRFFTPAPVRWS